MRSQFDIRDNNIGLTIDNRLRSVESDMIFFIYMFLANQPLIFPNFLLCCPSKKSARSQVPSQVATHQEIGSQLWAGESQIGTRDYRTTALRAPTEPPRLPTGPPCLTELSLTSCWRTD
jgi:hypothetical protein